MDAIDPNIVTIALAAATIAKILVDLVRATQKLPAWASPLLALLFSIAAAFLLQLAGGQVLTAQTAAVNVLAGVLAASTAVGSTELQKRTQQADLLAITAELVAERPTDPLPEAK